MPDIRISDADRDLFTHSSCSALADAIHAVTNWPRIVVSDPEVGWVHAGVRMPTGRVLDVNGDHDEAEWLDTYAEWADAYGEDIEGYDGENVTVTGAPVGTESWPSSADFHGPVLVRARQIAAVLIEQRVSNWASA